MSKTYKGFEALGLRYVIKTMKDRFGAKLDGYDANDRPIFIVNETGPEFDETLEYTIDEDNKVWIHDGFKDTLIGDL